MVVNILVFPCGSEIGMEIHNALFSIKNLVLFGGSSVKDHGRMIYANYIQNLPFIEEQNFIERINQIIDEYKINYIYPAHDSVVLKLAENVQNLHCEIITSPKETCRICRSKGKTYTFLKNQVKTPIVYSKLDNNLSFPIFLKPDVGQGSKGIHLINTRKELDFFIEQDPTLLILEYLPGKEYTVDCFTDRHGKLLFVGARERLRILNGISVNTVPILNDNRFKDIANKINDALKLKGSWFFQLKEDKNNNLTLLEIAPRIAGAMGLYRNLGINFEYLSILDLMGIDIEILYDYDKIELDRALINRFQNEWKYDHIYVDFDDTIVVNGKLNSLLIAFLIQSINFGKKIHLISKFEGNLKDKLKALRIDGIFDTIDQISKNEKKINFVKEKDAIFIDDSFSERKEVHNTLNIRVFDNNAFETLYDWRFI